jgi:hypothetical protein
MLLCFSIIQADNSADNIERINSIECVQNNDIEDIYKESMHERTSINSEKYNFDIKTFAVVIIFIKKIFCLTHQKLDLVVRR